MLKKKLFSKVLLLLLNIYVKVANFVSSFDKK